MSPTWSAVKRVGHKGADLIAPGNTPESFDAALAAGVDMIEFDVLSEHRDGTGTLYLAHDYAHIAGAISLEQGLDHLRQTDFRALELDIDLKLPGYEDQVVNALRSHRLIDRALVSTMEPVSLERLRELDGVQVLALNVLDQRELDDLGRQPALPDLRAQRCRRVRPAAAGDARASRSYVRRALAGHT